MIANDGVFRRVDHGLGVDRWESTINQLKLVGTQQRRPDRLDLHVRERFSNAAVTTGTERNVAEFLLTARPLHVQEPETLLRFCYYNHNHRHHLYTHTFNYRWQVKGDHVR